MTDPIVQATQDELRRWITAQLTEYRVGEEALEIRHWEKFDAVLDAQTRVEAQQLAKKCQLSIMAHLIHQWQVKKIPGPRKLTVVDDQAKKAESLAKSLEKKGEYEQAEKQRQRAARLRAESEQLTQAPAPTTTPAKRRKAACGSASKRWRSGGASSRRSSRRRRT